MLEYKFAAAAALKTFHFILSEADILNSTVQKISKFVQTLARNGWIMADV